MKAARSAPALPDQRRENGIPSAIILRMSSFSSRNRGFTLVEIMIVVAIIALLAAIAVPGFLRARKRSQATTVLNDLRLIDSAIDQYAMEQSKSTGAPVSVADWTTYLSQKGSNLYMTGSNLFGVSYGPQTVDTMPQVPAVTKTALSDVVDSSFWSPYN